MPSPSASYHLQRGAILSFPRQYMADAIAAADPSVDFRPYRIVYVVAAGGSQVAWSPSFLALPGDGVRADGVEIRHGVSLGTDTRIGIGDRILAHETGHLLGLPDLYDVSALFGSGVVDRFVGGWDLMGSLQPGAGFLAWHRWKLGWLDGTQIRCVRAGSLDATLTPLDTPGGLKAVVVPLSASTAYVVELRRQAGADAGVCDAGVLAYLVDASKYPGHGPVRVRSPNPDTNPDSLGRCGHLYNAPFDLGPGEVAAFEDGSLKVELLSRSNEGMRLRVTRS